MKHSSQFETQSCVLCGLNCGAGCCGMWHKYVQYTVGPHLSDHVLSSSYSEASLIRHSMGLGRSVGLGGCRITE
jgi:hypothetical protein